MDTSPGEVQEETAWRRLAPADPLFAEPAPGELPPPLVVSAPGYLNIHELPWATFEKLLLKLVRDIEDARDVRIYGTPGQKQHGIDLVGFFREQPPTVYQAKDVVKFTPADLRKAVEKYTSGLRPFDATRLVVAVACDTEDTKVIEELAKLRGEHPTLSLDLWGRVQLSELLEPHPWTVARFFGHATAKIFCSTYPPDRGQPEEPTAAIPADAISRGPLAHLDLLEEVNKANRLLEGEPGQAAVVLGSIATKLEASRFRADAARFRDRQASALEAASQHEAAAVIRLALGWQLIKSGDQWHAVQQVQEMEKHEDKLDAATCRAATALAIAGQFGRERQVTLDHMAAAFDALQPGDSFQFELALLLAEQAISWRRIDLITPRLGAFSALADGRPMDDLSQTYTARLRMCVADASGKWQALVREARRSYRPELKAWVLARHGRHLALSDQPEQAVESWEDAAFFATTEGFNSDAGDWLYSARAVHAKYGRTLEMHVTDIDEYHRKAQALRATGSKSMLPQPFPLRERALTRLSDEKWPDALEALHQYLWHSTVLGDWVDELTCQDLFGDLFRATQKPAEAVTHYIRAGSIKKVQNIGKNLPEDPVVVPTDVLSGPPWERATAYRFVVRAADLISDENAREWLDRAITEVKTSTESQWSVTGDPWYAAFAVMASFAGLTSTAQAGQILGLTRSYIPRKPGTFRHTDEDQVRALIHIAEAHSDLTDEALGQLCDGLVTDTQLGQYLVNKGSALLQSHPEKVSDRLADAARGGNYHASLALIVAGADPEPVHSLAQERLSKLLEPRAHRPGVMSFGSDFQAVAVLVGTLGPDEIAQFVTAMIDRAKDQHEAPIDRESALQAIMTVVQELPDSSRDEIFEVMMAFAAGEYEPSALDELLPENTDPFLRFRVNLGNSSSIRVAGIEAAAAAARTPEQYVRVQESADLAFGAVNDALRINIGRGLSHIPPENLLLDPRLAMGHPLPMVRALAAVKWASSPERDLTVGSQLARDQSSLVRRSLASALRRNRSEEVETILVQDVRRSVRNFVGER